MEFSSSRFIGMIFLPSDTVYGIADYTTQICTNSSFLFSIINLYPSTI
ncbi:MAG: hypothetical protein M0Q21_12210 [Ignavibacteriaceae bacterium]|nr:hypothetical protein [Ignavibacteriaceae bacterium]